MLRLLKGFNEDRREVEIMRNFHKNNGFTLIELSLVIVVIGLLVVGITQMFLTVQSAAKHKATETNIQIIREALKEHVIHYGYLPCPASRGSALGSAEFGAPTNCSSSTVAIGNCVNGYCVQAGRMFDHDDDITTPNQPMRVRVGDVPIRALNLPFSQMVDGNQYRLTYAVTEYLAQNKNNYKKYGGGIEIIDDSGTSVVIPPATVKYVVLSHGKSGGGAYTYADGKLVSSCPSDLSKGKDFNNCNYDTDPQAVFTMSSYSEAIGSNHYDDVISFAAEISSSAGETNGGGGRTVFTLWGGTATIGMDCPVGSTEIYKGQGRYKETMRSITGSNAISIAQSPPLCVLSSTPNVGDTPPESGSATLGLGGGLHNGATFTRVIEPCTVCMTD